MSRGSGNCGDAPLSSPMPACIRIHQRADHALAGDVGALGLALEEVDAAAAERRVTATPSPRSTRLSGGGKKSGTTRTLAIPPSLSSAAPVVMDLQALSPPAGAGDAYDAVAPARPSGGRHISLWLSHSPALQPAGFPAARSRQSRTGLKRAQSRSRSRPEPDRRRKPTPPRPRAAGGEIVLRRHDPRGAYSSPVPRAVIRTPGCRRCWLCLACRSGPSRWSCCGCCR